MTLSGSGPADLQRYNAATAHLEPPFAVVDLAALRANAADMARRAAGKPIRLASKSVRCRALIEQALAMDGFRGIMAFTLPEALWLAAHGTGQDILVAYPTADAAALARLADDAVARAAITVMIDCPDHLDMIEKAAATVPAAGPVRVCIDIDTSYVALGGRMRAGARRSQADRANNGRATADRDERIGDVVPADDGGRAFDGQCRHMPVVSTQTRYVTLWPGARIAK